MRTCDLYDISLREHFPDATRDEYIEMHQRIAAGLSIASARYRLRARDDTSQAAFLDLARGIHGTIFGEVFGPRAGRFRQSHEPVSVGHGHHEFQGAPPAEIEQRLREWRRSTGGLLNAPSDPGDFAIWAAIFLEHFLAVHPFRDGNGRTGRLLVEMAALGTGSLVVVDPDFRTQGEKTHDRNDYIYALQYAHKQRGITRAANQLGQRQDRDPFRGLARWWERRIYTLQDLEIVDEPPDWLASVYDDPWVDVDFIEQEAAALEADDESE